ncbi:retroviral-like aspartic protease [Iningainema tapete]|uniref:Retroviral-like aspartic protease n=1 Tax=Iningainema tapete BLCC-T55 TaxID=2748662 RepID=A0A8J6XME0_9CYAN|nr:retroviral-like aspartic protease [Iningainema tapete]MBD2777608.1 retroviral-like aspartic protease [Iningainema tapete BLCC-T55]
MLEGKRFAFIERINSLGVSSSMPYLPLTLTYRNRSVEVMALLDTGASVNVLPYDIGLQLGAVWEEQTTSVRLSGNLARLQARGLVVSAIVDEFSPILLAFAWTESREAPLILGHVNFFAEFDVCFYRSDLAFEIRPRRKPV